MIWLKIFVIGFSICTLIVLVIIHLIGKAADRHEHRNHTKEVIVGKMRIEFGQSKFNLYDAIGGALDQKSAWRRSMDVIFEVLDDNPNLMLDYLVERYGVHAVLEALADYGEEPDAQLR